MPLDVNKNDMSAPVGADAGDQNDVAPSPDDSVVLNIPRGMVDELRNVVEMLTQLLDQATQTADTQIVQQKQAMKQSGSSETQLAPEDIAALQAEFNGARR